MKTLQFDDEDYLKITLGSVSKSFIATYDQCPRKAKLKKLSMEEDYSFDLAVGKVSHEYFAGECLKRIGENLEMNLSYSPDILNKGKKLAMSVDYKNLIRDSKIIDVEKRVSVTLPNKLNLIGIFDLVLYCEGDEIYGDHIKIVDYKTSFKISREIDTEALIYAYLGAKYYKIPIIFARISGHPGAYNYWEEYFSVEDALKYEEFLDEHSSSIKQVIENEELPFPIVGAHCDTCPFLEDCASKGYSDQSFDEMVAELGVYESKVKLLKSKLKDKATHSNGEYISEIYSAKIKMSSSPKIEEVKKGKNKTVSKKEFIHLLAESGDLDKFISSLEVKYTPEILEKAKEFGLIIGESVRSSLDLGTTIPEDVDKIQEDSDD